MNKSKRNVIFLDIDGVLCTERSHAAFASQSFMLHLDPVGVRLIMKLCKETKSQLVLSSTWRKEFNQRTMDAILLNAGFETVPWHQCWKTPEFKYGIRGDEINAWLKNNGGENNCNYIIIDDNNDMLPHQMSRLILTDFNDGFLWNNYLQAKELLK